MTQFEPQDVEPDDEAGDPAKAFEALRKTVEDLVGDLPRELTTIRKALEAAFDRIAAFQQPADYSADLGHLIQSVAALAERRKAIEASPILKNAPEHYARALERGGESLMNNAVQKLERKAAYFERAGDRLAAYTKSAYDRRNQDVRM